MPGGTIEKQTGVYKNRSTETSAETVREMQRRDTTGLNWDVIM